MRKVLIANRGEIAVRVARACADAGLTSVAVYADPDADALHVRMADEAYALDGAARAETYLSIDKLVAIAARCGADAVHPGYGFLAENPAFAQAVLDAGLTWVGPSPEVIRTLGNKVTARQIAVAAGAPLVPGTDGPVASFEEVRAFAEAHGLPVAIKAVYGGGGRGLRIARRMADIEHEYDSAVREATAAFGHGECFVERFLDKPRHVEAQVVADTHGNVVVVGTRDCSLQRRQQKLVEEAPAPFLTDEQRERIHTSARDICARAGYTGAATVEYLLAADGTISFLEVNTRLQVEHPVTEETTGVDLVREQLRIADGEELSITQTPAPRGHAVEFRINAEDPAHGFLPSPGPVERFETPTGPGVRIDTGVRSGSFVPGEYDSMLAKLIVWGPDRATALTRARIALDELAVDGLATVLPFHRAVVRDPAFTGTDSLGVWTTWIETEFAHTLEASEHVAAALPANRRTTITVDIDGRAHRLGLPADLLAALQGAGRRSSGDVGAAAGQQVAEPAGGGPGTVSSPMGGSLVKWTVEDGAAVAAGETVAVVEAMKMESPVKAPAAGTFRRGAQQPGAALRRGETLGRVE